MKPVNVKLTKPPEASFKLKNIALKTLEFNWHCHPEYEIMFMFGSKGKRFIGDSISYYDQGDLFFIGPNLPHTWYSRAGTMGKNKGHEAILIQFVENFAGLNVRTVPELFSLEKLFHESTRGIQLHGKTREVVATKIRELQTKEGLSRLIVLLSILEVLSRARERDREVLSSIEFTRRLQPHDQSRIDRVCTFINENYKDRIRLEDAASIVNMSTTAFSRFFKKSTGKTFVGYVNALRIGWACKLLIESDMNIAEISYEVGFNNLSNFNRRFAERHHMNPREYRHQFALSN
ncbi:MAG: helix-turn-helix domain-containing protein [bacterium]|nr:MAG: helix-turn-helix domain-containing protein [bacterium]